MMKNKKVNSFTSGSHYNRYANDKEVKKIDREEFKRTWHITLIKTLISIVGIFVLAICSIVIYKTGADLLNGNEVADIFGYIDYIVNEDNLSPLINKDDLLIIKKEQTYQEQDIVLYFYKGNSKKLGKIEDIIRNEYIITDNNINKGDYNSQISSELVIGKKVLIIKNFKLIYNIFTSPFTIILLIIITLLYFYMISRGKIKERSIV